MLTHPSRAEGVRVRVRARVRARVRDANPPVAVFSGIAHKQVSD